MFFGEFLYPEVGYPGRCKKVINVKIRFGTWKIFNFLTFKEIQIKSRGT